MFHAPSRPPELPYVIVAAIHSIPLLRTPLTQVKRNPHHVTSTMKRTHPSLSLLPSPNNPPPATTTTRPASLLATCVSFLQDCALHGDLARGKQTHSFMLMNGLQASPFSITSLVSFYSKCACPRDALVVFRGVESPNLFMWNAIVAGMVGNGLASEALGLYCEMREVGLVPDSFTLPCVINACCGLKMVKEVRKIHGFLFKVGLESNLFVASAMVGCHVKLDFVEEAERMFDELPERDLVLWNSMVNGFAQMGRFQNALRFFQRMESEGILPSSYTVTGIISVFASTGDLENGKRIHELAKKCGYDTDVTVSNSLIDMYGKCGDVEEALQIFELMPERNVFSWNSIISVIQQVGDHVQTLKLFDRMRKAGAQPDSVTISAVLPACAQISALAHGREIHGYMIVNGLKNEGNLYVENSIMDMYIKCGNLHDARSVFDMMESHDVASWNILIGGYASHGQEVKALDLFSVMCNAGIAPDDVTFVCILSACGHGGLVDRGRWILEHMESDYKVVPTLEHYSCVVDMLGRAGRLAEAHDMLVNLPTGSNPVVWRSYMAACKGHGETDRAVEAAGHLLEMEPEHGGSYVLLSNVYGSEGRFGDVLEVRSSMRNQKVRKVPGCSWIELKSGMHVFINRDRRHPDTEKIYFMLNILIGCLRELGYAPDATQGE